MNMAIPKEPDMVNHPPHYASETGLETIDVIEAFTSKLTGIEATDTGNVLKYMCRWKEKNGLQDLEKARWYLNHLIEHVEMKSNILTMKKINCPTCEKELIRLEPYKVGVDEYWCDNCNISIRFGDVEEIMEKEND